MRFLHSGSTSTQAFTAQPALRYFGYNVKTDAGAQVTVHHGTTALDPVLSTISLAANESANDWIDEDGVETPDGIYINITAGDCEISIYARN